MSQELALGPPQKRGFSTFNYQARDCRLLQVQRARDVRAACPKGRAASLPGTPPRPPGWQGLGALRSLVPSPRRSLLSSSAAACGGPSASPQLAVTTEDVPCLLHPGRSWRSGLAAKKKALQAEIRKKVETCDVDVPVIALGGGTIEPAPPVATEADASDGYEALWRFAEEAPRVEGPMPRLRTARQLSPWAI